MHPTICIGRIGCVSGTGRDPTLGILPTGPADKLLVTESGILSCADVERMRAAQVHAFLVGEAFMRAPDPGAALADLFKS